MSLHTALTAFGSMLKQKKSSTPLRKALEDFARAVDPKTARQKFPAQQRTLTKLAQCMLNSASAVGEEDNKIIGSVCTLVADALTQQVRAEARASDDDWRWLARCPDRMLDCDAGGYDEAEALVRHLLECPWAELLSPLAISALLDRLKALSDAPDIGSAKLMSLYEQYCIQHQAGDKASIRHDRENASVGPGYISVVEKTGDVGNSGEVGKRRRVGSKRGGGKVWSVDSSRGGAKPGGLEASERAEVRREDASIVADGAGLAADNAEVHDSEMDLPIIGYVPASDVASDDDSVMRAYGDTNIFAITATDMSVPFSSLPDTLVFDTSVVDAQSDTTQSDSAAYDVTVFDAAATGTAVPNTAVIDVTATDAVAPDTVVIDTTVADDALLDTTMIDPTLIDPALSAIAVQPEGEFPDSIAPVAADGINADPPVDQNLTGSGDETVQSTASHREATSEPMVHASNDDVLTEDALVNHEPSDARPATGALFSSVCDNGDSQRISDSDVNSGHDVATGGPLPAHAGSPPLKSHLLVQVQLSLPGMKVPESVVSGETAVAEGEQHLTEPDFDDAVNSATDICPVRDEATIDMFDELGVTAGDRSDSLDFAALSAREPDDTQRVDTITSDSNARDEIAITSGDIERIDDDNLEVESLGSNESAGDVEEVVVARALTAPRIRKESRVREEQTEDVPLQSHKFNTFDGAVRGDDRDDHEAQAINLHGFVLEDASTIINEDEPVGDVIADVEKPGLLAGVQSALIGSESASKDAAGISEAGDAEAGDLVASATGEERNESEPAPDDIFDAFDGTAFGDDRDDHEAQAINLHGFVLEDASTIINEDEPVADAFTDVEQSGLLAGVQLPLIGFESASKEAAGTSEAGDAEAGDLVAAATGEQRNELEPAPADIFDAFDGTAFWDDSDDDAVSLDAFVPREKSPRTASEDVPVADVFSGATQSGLLAGVQLPLIGFESASKEAAGTGEAGDAEAGDLVAAATGEERNEPQPVRADIFDVFDATAFGDDADDDAVSLDEFVQGEQSQGTANDDVPAVYHVADVERPGLLAGVHLPLTGSESASKDATDTAEAKEAAVSAAADAVHNHAEKIEAEPALDDIFDALDDASLGDAIGEDAVNLDGFLLTEDAPTNINDDVPAADEPVDVEPSGKLASMQSPVSGSQDASKAAAVAGEAGDNAGFARQSSTQKPAPADKKLSRAAMRIVEVLLAELPNVEVELAICSGLDQSNIIDSKVDGEARQRCTEVLERFGSAADSVGFVGLAKIIDIACERVRSVAQIESQPDTQVRLLAQFAEVVRAYFNAPHTSEAAQSLIDWAVNDGWVSPARIDDPEALLSLLANPDLSAVDEDASVRQQRANLEDISLAVPADVNSDLLDGLLQELPLQCEEFSAAIERLMHGTGEHEDILVAQRIAHTIKGSGNTVGIRGLATLTHNIEDILLVLAQEKRLPSQPLADMLMNAADRLEAMTESLLGMGPPPEDAMEVLQCVLDWANMIDREGLPTDDATPQSLPDFVHAPLVGPLLSIPVPSEDVENAVPVPANEASRSVAEDRKLNEARESELENKVDTELEALLRVPARLIDELLTSAGESIILTGQLRDRVRRAVADLSAMSVQFERQQQLGGDLEKLIDIKDFSRLQAQNDVRFDALEMDQYNELHSVVRQLVESATDAREMGHALVDHLSSLDEMLINQEDLNRDTQDTVLHTRMVSVKSVFARLQRAVRQTCRATAKQVELHLSGGETPMDSDALIRIVDPLMHLLRNAIDHGIENAETRLRNGKAATGNVYLDFQRKGNDIVIKCRDDGAGLNYDAIRHAAEKSGLIGPDVSLDALKQIILRANFSTRAQASQVSGRGIGLDAVHTSVLALGGTMTVESESGHGCDFELRLPFNLIASHALLVRAGPNVVALASRGVKQIVHGSEGEMQRFGDKTVFQVGDDVYPATTLEAVIGDKDERRDGERRSRPVVLAHTDEGVTAVSVHSVIGSRDLVVKSLGKLLPKFRGVVGATILGDGHVSPVIDLPDILSNRDAGAGVDGAIATDSPIDSNSGFVLVVDDSLSARRALVQFMQDSGYRVRTARDGLEATKLLEGARPDLVLADLEMPRMNGIELTVHLRATAETADVPVIMITSRSTTKHREQAQSAGVNAYFTKPYSENMLIETVRGLIREQQDKRDDRPAA